MNNDEQEAYREMLRCWDRWWEAKEGHEATMVHWDQYKEAEARWETLAGIPHIVPKERPNVIQETR